MEITIRKPLTDEKPALREIWRRVFATEDEKLFFSYHYSPDASLVADHAGVPVASGYVFPVGSFAGAGKPAPCAMIYAVATLPEHRSRGYGAAIVRELISAAQAAGYPAVILRPSEDSLFEYYNERSELRDMFYISEKRYQSAPAGAVGIKPTPATADEYSKLRKALLS